MRISSDFLAGLIDEGLKITIKEAQDILKPLKEEHEKVQSTLAGAK